MRFTRIKKRKDFIRVSREGAAYRSKSLILLCAESCEALTPRFGFTASKRVGNAVLRNRAKRKMRELVSLWLKQHNQKPEVLKKFDFVLIATYKTPDIDFQILQKQFHSSMCKAMAAVIQD